jgi:hypothetical protein
MRKVKDLTRGKAVRVAWVDSSTRHGWTEKEIPGRTGKIISLGYVTDVRNDCLTLSTSIAENADSISPLSIPWVCIVDLVILPDGYDRNKNLPK